MNKNQWINKAVIYHIFPLGLCGAPKWNEGENLLIAEY